jgi:acetoin utilization deacetylase AcuC-like enzyme
MSAVLFYCDHHEFPLPAGHKFPVRKYRLLRELLTRETDYRLQSAPAASRQELYSAHDPEYVDSFVDGTISSQAIRRIGFPWSEELVARTLGSAGGTLAAAKLALEHGFSGTLAGGTHHAFRAEGSGFCVFNDIAVAIRHLGLPRPAVIDLDVHQGDGTAQIFAGDPDVFTLSIHSRNNFPFRKQQSSLDIELEDNCGDAEYLGELDRALVRVEAFRPRFLFYQSGVDGLAADKLGRLALSHDGLLRRDRRVFEFARAMQVPLVVTLGGGYADPIELTVEAHANTFREATTYLQET